MRIFSIIGLVAASLLLLGDPAAAEPRVALVIGNSSYGGDLGQLPNPANDAKLMAKTLNGIGFAVIEAEDADLTQMRRAIQEFGAQLAQAGDGATGLFFYAGHGVQVGGTNYLIPIHAKIDREGDADIEAVPVDLVMKQMAFAESAVNIVILDACRNNPLARSMRAVTRGLADPSTRPMGSFIAYSTAPGDVAEDGEGANSPYTTALAAAIVKPGASINDVFQEVRGKVLAATNKKQVPWDASSLTAPFYFVPAAAPAVADAVDPKAIELAFWQSIQGSRSAEDYQAYLEQFPHGDFAALARLRLKAADPNSDRAVQGEPTPAPSSGSTDPAIETAFWDAVNTDASAESYQAYLNKYPSGQFTDLAQRRLKELSAPEQQVSVAPAPKAPFPDIVATSATIYAKDKALLREAPSADAEIFMQLAANRALEATGRTTDDAWWRVKLADGQIGFVAATAVTDQPSPATTTPPAPDVQQQAAAASPPPAPKPTGTDEEACAAASDTSAPDRAAACQRLLTAGIADETRRYNVLMDLGRAFFDQERYEDALKNYRAAADIDPNFFGAFQMIGRVNLDQGKLAEARTALETAVSLDPQQADSVFYRGAAKRRLGDFDAAIEDIQRAIKMNPDQPDYAEERGLLYLMKGDIASAAAEADRAAALEPDGWMIASTFAYYLDRRYDDALVMTDRALQAAPGWAYWWIWKAMIQRGKGDPAGALATLTQAQQRFAKTDWPRPVIDFMAGKIDAGALRRAGQGGNALEQKQRRCEIEFYIGIEAGLRGDTAEARAALRRVQGTRVYEYIEYMVAPSALAVLEPR